MGARSIVTPGHSTRFPLHTGRSLLSARPRQTACNCGMMDADLAKVLACRIILGTQSSSRRQIMQELSEQHGSFVFETCAAGIDEQAIRAEKPEDLVRLLAEAKATAILATGAFSDGYLITCDQVVVHEGRILEKPESPQQARDFISGYSRSPPSTVGSVMVTHLASRRSVCEVDTATIHFSPIPAASVEALLAEGDVMYSAGGLTVEHPLVAPHVLRMEGTLDAVMGLPKALVVRLLLEASRLA